MRQPPAGWVGVWERHRTFGTGAGCGPPQPSLPGGPEWEPIALPNHCISPTKGQEISLDLEPQHRALNGVLFYNNKTLNQEGFTGSLHPSVRGFRLSWFQKPNVLRILHCQKNGRKGISLATGSSHAYPRTNHCVQGDDCANWPGLSHTELEKDRLCPDPTA